MKFALDDQHDGMAIDSYSQSEIRIGGRAFASSLLIGPEKLAEGLPSELGELESEHFDSLLDQQVQVVVLGTGERQIFPPASLYAQVLRAGIGVEVMSTPSACRTYNILLAEGRRVGALLILDAQPPANTVPNA